MSDQIFNAVLQMSFTFTKTLKKSILKSIQLLGIAWILGRVR